MAGPLKRSIDLLSLFPATTEDQNFGENETLTKQRRFAGLNYTMTSERLL